MHRDNHRNLVAANFSSRPYKAMRTERELKFAATRSALVLPLAAVLLLAHCGCGPSDAPSSSPASNTKAPPPAPAAADWFEDITARTGLDFIHTAGTNYFMPDQVGSGIALLDYDGDGRLDVYCLHNASPGVKARNQLFHQEEDGTFRDVSEGSGADLGGRGMGAYAGDLNNDGKPELLVTEYGAVRMLLNLGGGRFEELAPAASGVDNPRWAAPAAFVDYDRDGWLDIVVGNYLDYDPTQICHDVQGRQDFCAPKAFPGTVTRLWRNVTGTPGQPPRFQETTESAGLTAHPGVALGLVCADFDGDGWVDIFCSDDGRPNRLFINGRDGSFREEAMTRGLAFNAMGATAANMGTSIADVDGDGMWDLFITHLAEEFHGFWKQGPRGLFIDQVAAAGLQTQAWRGTGFGTVFADFNRDGHVDLAFANGLVRRATPGQTPVAPDVSPWWARYAQRAQVFANDGQGRFVDRSPVNPAFSGQAMVGRSLAVGDLDRDGAPDLLLGNVSGRLRVYRNVAAPAGHWLGLSLVDPSAGGRDAIGAECVVRAAGRSWWGLLQPATSYLVSNAPVIQLGLGAVDRIERVEVLWPDGSKESFSGPPVDQWATLAKGSGREETP